MDSLMRHVGVCSMCGAVVDFMLDDVGGYVGKAKQWVVESHFALGELCMNTGRILYQCFDCGTFHPRSPANMRNADVDGDWQCSGCVNWR